MTAMVRLASGAAAVLILLAGCGQQPPQPAASPVQPVLSMVVEPAPPALPSFAGTVQPQVTTALAFRVGGRVTSRPADVGAMVTTDEILASLDTTTLQLSVQTARASLASAQSQLALATNEAGRQQALLQSNAIAQSVYQQAQQQQAAAQSAVVRAQSDLTVAQQQLSYAQITATYNGIVTAVSANVGDIVSAGQTIVTIAKPDARDAVIDVSESLVGSVRIGAPFTVALQLEPRISASGSVREIAPQADTATRTRQVKIGLVNPPATFWLGTTVTATQQEQVSPVISIPRSAVFTDGGESKVWVIDPTTSTVGSRTVTLGQPGGASVPVSGGLQSGTRIVTAGVNQLTEGQKVKLAEGPSL